MRHSALIILFLFSTNSISFAQDSVRLMTYNILNYPYVAASRADTLAIIIDAVLPDILIVNELQNNTGANAILNNAMNSSGRTNYSKAIFYNGGDSDNMCYYDNNKFGLFSQNQIATSIRDISEYVLFWKGNLPSADTIYFNVYSVHLKASSGASNEAQRLAEAQILKARIDNRSGINNIFVGGDFNIYDASEPAYQEIITGGITDLFDPINSAGSWHVNAAYAGIHTQATGSINGGSGGGLDDRFDFFFVSSDIINGTNSVQYIDGTYKAYGQDGNRFNSDLNVWPSNTVVSAQIASALYNMSDHLPVIMDVVVDPTLDIEGTANSIPKLFHAEKTKEIVFSSATPKERVQIEVIDLLGKRLKQKTFGNASTLRLKIDELKTGIYLASAKSDNVCYSIKFIIR